MKLMIRKMTDQDLEPLCVLLSDPDVMRYLEPPYSNEQTRKFLSIAMSDHPPVYAVDLNGCFIGYVIYHLYEKDSMEIGWVLLREHWGKGYGWGTRQNENPRNVDFPRDLSGEAGI